jgi:hypothetical protein
MRRPVHSFFMVCFCPPISTETVREPDTEAPLDWKSPFPVIAPVEAGQLMAQLIEDAVVRSSVILQPFIAAMKRCGVIDASRMHSVFF